MRYAGLKGHRDHRLAQKYFGGHAGGVFCFDLKGSLEDGQSFLHVSRTSIALILYILCLGDMCKPCITMSPLMGLSFMRQFTIAW